MMTNAIAHFGAPAAAVAIAALVSAAAVLGARFGVPEGCASASLRERRAPVPLVAQRSLDQNVSVEQRIAFARDRLRITPEQVPHWDAVAGALRDQAVVLDGIAGQSTAAIEPAGQHVYNRPVAAQGDWPGTTARAASDKQFAAAWAALYDRLTDEQKDTAASLLIRHDGRRR
jgi:hypothetical protein